VIDENRSAYPQNLDGSAKRTRNEVELVRGAAGETWGKRGPHTHAEARVA
jgi:hypothetical protein